MQRGMHPCRPPSGSAAAEMRACQWIKRHTSRLSTESHDVGTTVQQLDRVQARDLWMASKCSNTTKVAGCK